jgi:hypothetical protein
LTIGLGGNIRYPNQKSKIKNQKSKIKNQKSKINRNLGHNKSIQSMRKEVKYHFHSVPTTNRRDVH